MQYVDIQQVKRNQLQTSSGSYNRLRRRFLLLVLRIAQWHFDEVIIHGNVET